MQATIALLASAVLLAGPTEATADDRLPDTYLVESCYTQIKDEVDGAKRTYLPMHAVVRVDEVEKQGVSKMTALEGGNVAQFPVPMYTPGGKDGK